tara:strand:- start:526732 stop:527337 length:606 start_codon:yes stop_codon:yes gene_type:complete
MKEVWRKFLVLISIFACYLSFGQTEGGFPIVEGQIPFKIFKTQKDNYTIHDLLKNPSLFTPISEYPEKTHPQDVFWIRLDLEQTLPYIKGDSTWYLVYNSFDHAELFYWGNQMISKKAIGRFDNNTAGNQIKSAKYFSETRVDSNYIINGRYLFLKTKRVLFYETLKTGSLGIPKFQQKTFLPGMIRRKFFTAIFSPALLD